MTSSASPRMLSEMFLTVCVPQFSRVNFSLRLRKDIGVSNCGQKFKKIVSFDDIAHFIDEENIVTYVYFNCGFTFYPETYKNQTDQPRTEIHSQILCKTKLHYQH